MTPAFDGTDQLHAALWAVRRGWHVFPTDHPALPHCVGVGAHHDPRACDLGNGKKRGKHPALAWGRMAAQYGDDLDEVTRWFTTDPRNVAIACKPSGLLVVDEDTPGAFARFAAAKGVTVPETFTVSTGRGRHYYFTNPANLGNAPKEFKGHGIDIRGGGGRDGGYVIGPGSLHSTGVIYTPDHPDAQVAECPDWLIDALGGHPAEVPAPVPGTPAARLDLPVLDQPRTRDHTRPVPAGERYQTLLSYAGRLRRSGLDYEEAEALFRARWERCEQPPGDERTWAESVATLKDVFDRYDAGTDLAQEHGQEVTDEPVADRLSVLRSLLVDSTGLDSIPDPEPIIDSVLFRDSLAWLHGKPGHGKSFVALDWAGSVATGRTWHGNAITRPGGVVYLVAEGVTGVRQRVRAWEDAAGAPMAGVRFLPVAVQLLSPTDRDAFVALVAELTPALVVIDTQARVTVGADENSAQDMGRLVAAADAIRDATSACVLLVHHEARSGDTLRGSTALEGAATTLIRVTKDGVAVRIDCTKQKDAEPFPPLLLRLVPRGAGAVLESHSGVGPGRELAPSDDKLLSAMRDSFGTTGATSAQLKDAAAVAKSSFYRSLNVLVTRGLLINTGTDKRPFYTLAGSTGPTAVPTGSNQSHGSTGDRSQVPHPSRGVADGTGSPRGNDKTPCRECGKPQRNAGGSPSCFDCRPHHGAA
ncbi:hypothetical protein GCM10009551_022190 [Nocardiopsis tropica]|uniref:AAA family ATPase n=1 Tax=Nocardiopsis tropica TaxID=109330 RepID=UPI0031D6117A